MLFKVFRKKTVIDVEAGLNRTGPSVDALKNSTHVMLKNVEQQLLDYGHTVDRGVTNAVIYLTDRLAFEGAPTPFIEYWEESTIRITWLVGGERVAINVHPAGLSTVITYDTAGEIVNFKEFDGKTSLEVIVKMLLPILRGMSVDIKSWRGKVA